jgi:hypothetical protein
MQRFRQSFGQLICPNHPDARNYAVVGDEMPLISALGIRPRAIPEIVRAGVVTSLQTGADGIGLGHFDGASLHLLRAIKAGLADADAAF